jgi:CBS domain containing-hemolysin-like protein
LKLHFKDSLKWSTKITFITLTLAAFFAIISSFLLSGAPLAIGMVVVIIIILIGIAADTIGLSSAASSEEPFHAMASKKINGSKEAVQICRNAPVFSSFFNDVIGDICGVVSGTATAVVVLQLLSELGKTENSITHFIVTVAFTSVVAALTVGGKAICKTFAIRSSTNIILFIGKICYHLDHKFSIKLFKT